MENFSFEEAKENFASLTFKGKPLVPDLYHFGKAIPVITVFSKENIQLSLLFEVYDKTIEQTEIELLFPGPPPGIIYKGRLFFLDTEIPYKKLVSLPRKIKPEEIDTWPGAILVGERPPNKEARRLYFSDFWGIDSLLKEKTYEDELLIAGFKKHPSRQGHFIAPKESLFSAVDLLTDSGWEIFDHRGKRIVPLSRSEISWEKDNQGFSAEGLLFFEEQQVTLSKLSEERIVLDEHRVGLLPEGLSYRFFEKKEGGKVHLPKKALFQLQLLSEKGRGQKDTNTIFPTKAFIGKLREYQLEGMRFLFSHYCLQTGALLADDMGLGKTIQTLAFLSLVSNEARILLITPKTLLFNWQREIERFLPERKEAITLVSYGEVRANQEKWQKKSWDIVILDEAQMIKNQATLTHQAVLAISTPFRLSLTGTPVENRLEELRNHFSFLLPDSDFSSEASSLKKETAPYILRRRKEEVLKELPDKIEESLLLPLHPEQERAYLEVREKWSTAGGIGVLEAILRLRQLALHPKLLGLPIEESVKLDVLKEEVEEIAASGHKVAVFSHFTSFLAIAKARLESHFPILVMDGSTKDRQGVVDSFQNEAKYPALLMNLQVGGVGINLTAADYVILLDPWWNEAQENQAISRAHRMGRKNQVIVRRYIAKGTIEEKMVLLQEKKRALSTYLLGESPLPQLTEQELLSLI